MGRIHNFNNPDDLPDFEIVRRNDPNQYATLEPLRIALEAPQTGTGTRLASHELKA